MKTLITTAVLGLSLIVPGSANAAKIKDCGNGQYAAYYNVTTRAMKCSTAQLLANKIYQFIPERCNDRNCRYRFSFDSRGTDIYRVRLRHVTDQYGCDNIDVRAKQHQRVTRFQSRWGDCGE